MRAVFCETLPAIRQQSNQTTMKATILPAPENTVEFIAAPVCCDGRFFARVSVPQGWEQVKPHCNMRLEFEGRTYGWSCWDSDRMESVFVSPAPRRLLATVR